MDVAVALLLALGFSMVAGRAVATKESHLILVALVLAAAFALFAKSASSAWREDFPPLDTLTGLFPGDVVELECWEDETHPDFDSRAWPSWHADWEAQVIAEESAGVWRLNVFPDLMVGKTSFEQFWFGDLFFAELPHVQLKDFGYTWPDIGPDVGHLRIRKEAGVWSIDSHTRLWRYGWCGTREFGVMTGEEVDVTWDETEQAYLGTYTVTGLPGYCFNRRWQPYRCEASAVRCQTYCAFLAEADGRWEELLDRMRRYVEVYDYTPAQVEGFFEWQLAKLEAYTSGNICVQAGDPAGSPEVIFAQCEILQELIDANRTSPSRVALWAPQYARLGCPCSADSNGNGLPDYFDGEPWECPDVAIVAETTAHEAYLIPVPEPGRLALMATGLAALSGLARLRLRRPSRPTA